MNSDDAINRVLANEGGLVDDPNDPGGLTNWGWALHENPDLTADQIRSMTRDQAAARYKARFWDPMTLDGEDPAVAYQLLDFAVNAGMGTAIRTCQSVIGVAPDGNFGPLSHAALQRMPTAKFMVAFAAAKIRYYTKLSTFPKEGIGWMNRVAVDLDYAGSDTTT